MQRILIVDDEPDMTDTCRRILSPAGYKCLTSNNALEALNLLGAERPDLLLTDLRMPEMDGMEMLRRARSTRRCRSCCSPHMRRSSPRSRR